MQNKNYESGFERIYGYEDVKKVLYNILDCMDDASRYKKLGAKMPHGLLLTGIPGVGKTILSKAFIKMSNRHAYMVDSACGSNRICDQIKAAFVAARTNQPSIILLDDFDKYQSRYDDNGAFRTLQSCIDKVSDDDVFVVGTINEIRRIPASLTRDGRFDYIINIEGPNQKVREQFVSKNMKSHPFEKSIIPEDIASLLSGKTCAEIDSFFNQSAMNAAYRNSDMISIEDIIKSYAKIQVINNNEDGEDTEDLDYDASDNPNMVGQRLNGKDVDRLEEVAYHEVGHLLVSEACNIGSIGFVSILNYKDLDSYCLINKQATKRSHIIITLLGGKASVEMQFGILASGCSSDIQSAEKLIREGLTRNANRGYKLTTLDDNSKVPEEVSAATTVEFARYDYVAKEIMSLNREFINHAVILLKKKKYLLLSDIKQLEKDYPINNQSIINL